MALMESMMGVIFDSVRPSRMSLAGCPEARKMAVWDPRLLVDAPVITTEMSVGVFVHG